MFKRWMKELFQDQGLMFGQEDPGLINDQDRSIKFKS